MCPRPQAGARNITRGQREGGSFSPNSGNGICGTVNNDADIDTKTKHLTPMRSPPSPPPPPPLTTRKPGIKHQTQQAKTTPHQNTDTNDNTGMYKPITRTRVQYYLTLPNAYAEELWAVGNKNKNTTGKLIRRLTVLAISSCSP